MIKFTATAFIHGISPVIDIPSKTGGQPFQKRDLILNDPWTDRDNQQHDNFVLVEFSGDRMAQLDNFQPGQRVNVEISVNGREYNNRVFNSLRGMSVSPYQPQHYPSQMGQRPAPSPAPMPGGYAASPQPAPAPSPAYQQQTAQPQAPSYQQPQYPAPAQQPYAQYPAAPGMADLPFRH